MSGRRWVPLGVALLLHLAACADQPLGLDYRLHVEFLGTPGITGGPADTVALAFQVFDQDGAAVAGASAVFQVEGEGAGILSADGTSGIEGLISAEWRLGTRATEDQRLMLEVRSAGRSQHLELRATVIPRDIASLAAPDSFATRLHSPSPLTVVATDPYGNQFVPEAIGYRSTDTMVFVIDSTGIVHGRSRGTALAIAASGELADTSTVHIFQVAGSIAVADTVSLHSIGQSVSVAFTILSDSGNPIRDTIPGFTVNDTAIAVLTGTPSDSAVTFQSRANGTAVLTISVGGIQRDVTIDVRQRSRVVNVTPAGPLAFDALGDSVQLNAVAFDSLGVTLAAPAFTFSAADSSVVAVGPAGVVRSAGNGSTVITAREATGGSAAVAAMVAQVADSLEVFWIDTAPIISAAQFAPPPLHCLARDRNGYPLAQSPSVASQRGTVFGLNCATLAVRASGYDTLTFTAGVHSTQLTSLLVVRPLVSSPVGDFVTLDSFPFDYRLWAPSGRINSQGDIEIYVTGYEFVHDSNGVGPGSLHRLVSSDGVRFRYDGIALGLLPPPCGLICSGIENIAVVSREDGPGWRMFFAAGSSGTYGWQVFSAVSTDERSWTIEPGVRISNGGPVPPAPPGTVPWPVGEGLVIDQLPSGEWRMVVGGYERIPNPPNRFEIVEYRSSDQLTWTYQGTLLTAAQLPATAQRTIYSPTITEFVPGLWRMFVTGDDLNLPGGRSRIFSAVSRDRETWQFEAELLGGPGTDLYYSVLVNDLLYFLRQDTGQQRRLAAVTLTMP